MMVDFPTEVDVIVIGTGVTETIVAAAFARAGKTVLHLDSNKYYGSDWASFTLTAFLEWSLKKESGSCFNIEFDTFISEADENGELPEGDPSHHVGRSMTKLKTLNNKFCIDLCPRLIFSRGPMVDLLVDSNICRYLEFKNCTRLLMIKTTEEGLTTTEVPCERQSVFNDRSLSLIQKRRLMKFIEYCSTIKTKAEDWDQIKDISFEEFLQRQGFDELLTSVVRCVAAQDVSSVSDFLDIMNYFTLSVGRFGPTPFLWTLYGSGELPQAFTRLCAVFGGIYCLGQDIKGVEKTEDAIEVSFDDNTVKCKIVVGNQTSLPSNVLQAIESAGLRRTSSHAVCLTNRSIKGIDESQITFSRISWSQNVNITFIEVGSGSLCVPKGFFLVYLSTVSDDTSLTAKAKLSPLVEKLFTKVSEEAIEGKPQVLWSCYYDRLIEGTFTSLVDGVSVVQNPQAEQDYESSINEAKSIFHHYFPTEDFLPRAPDAEDIIIEDAPQEDEENGVDVPQ